MKSEIPLFVESFFWTEFANNQLYVCNLDCASESKLTYFIDFFRITSWKK